MSQITHDRRAIRIDGSRRLLLSGSIHYPRSTPDMWPAMMDRSLQAGINTLDTYVFWNLHERRRGVLDFSGRLNLPAYLELAWPGHGLRVILRMGPYICAETNYGGFPPWLRDVPGMRMRTYNEPFLARDGPVGAHPQRHHPALAGAGRAGRSSWPSSKTSTTWWPSSTAPTASGISSGARSWPGR